MPRWSQPENVSQPTTETPVRKHVRKYKPEEIDLEQLSRCAEEVLNKKPFLWQLEVAVAILCGEDVIVDVGTGCGKTLCFILPLFLATEDIVVVVSPLSALMIDQVSSVTCIPSLQGLTIEMRPKHPKFAQRQYVRRL